MEYDINRIRTLCDKYFDGETTVDEEIMLKAYFMTSALAVNFTEAAPSLL